MECLGNCQAFNKAEEQLMREEVSNGPDLSWLSVPKERVYRLFPAGQGRILGCGKTTGFAF